MHLKVNKINSVGEHMYSIQMILKTICLHYNKMYLCFLLSNVITCVDYCSFTVVALVHLRYQWFPLS